MQATTLKHRAYPPTDTEINDHGMLPQGYSAARVVSQSCLQRANELYRRVFGYDDPSMSLNPNLIMSLGYHGGSSVGIFDRHHRLVGYAYGFPGLGADGELFHFSQAAVVAPGEQGRGLGKALKVLQAKEAALTGRSIMRWTFDPMIVKNAYFNLNSLGANAIDYLPSYFDRPGSDRLLVSWDLAASASRSASPEHPPVSFGRPQWGAIVEGSGEEVWIPVPADSATLAEPVREQINTRLGKSLTAVLDDGRILNSCRRVTDDTAAYLAVRAAPSEPTPTRESHGKEQE